jgi:hypothetical protein
MKKIKIKKASSATYYIHIVGAAVSSLMPIAATVVEKAMPVTRAVVASTLPVMAYFRAGETQAIAIDFTGYWHPGIAIDISFNEYSHHRYPSSSVTPVKVPSMRVSEISAAPELKDSPLTQAHDNPVAIEPAKSDLV